MNIKIEINPINVVDLKLAKIAIDSMLNVLESNAITVEELGLSKRARNILHSENIRTVADIIKTNKDDQFAFMRMDHLGQKSIKEIADALAFRGVAVVIRGS